jgi:hypothetical protein
MPGTRPGMTISVEFSSSCHGRACLAIDALAGIPLIALQGAFFGTLSVVANVHFPSAL